MSFPNPNTRNEVFVDDMEGVRDAVSLSLTPDRWRWSSIPKRIVGGVPQSFLALPKQRNAEIHWYVPVSSSGKSDDQDLVHERDLRPRLSDGQGAQNVRTVLSISIPRTPRDFVNSTLGVTDTMWAGLTYNPDGVDDAGEKALLADSTNTGYRLADLVTANPEDPEGDDWGGLITNFPSAVDPRRYVLTNGTERSKDAFPIPDTEDMNLNGQPDTT